MREGRARTDAPRRAHPQHSPCRRPRSRRSDPFASTSSPSAHKIECKLKILTSAGRWSWEEGAVPPGPMTLSGTGEGVAEDCATTGLGEADVNLFRRSRSVAQRRI